MKKAAVCIDAWKLPIFKRRLDDAGYAYRECPGITPDTLTLQVNYKWVHELQPIIEAAQKECAKAKA